MIQSIKKGQAFVTDASLEKIKEFGFTENILRKLYAASNDPLQRMLIVEVGFLKGYDIADNEPQVA